MATRLPPHKALHIRLDADPASSFLTMPAHPRGGTLISVTWLRTMHARVQAMDPFRADIGLAALFVVASVIEVFSVPSRGDDYAVTVAAAVVAQAALAWRRREPLVAAVVFAVPTALQAAF